MALEDFQKNPDNSLESISAMLQQRVRSFVRACARHDSGELTDEEYALWKSKFPVFLEDFKNATRERGEDAEIASESDIVPVSEPKLPGRNRKRKINNGHRP